MIYDFHKCHKLLPSQKGHLKKKMNVGIYSKTTDNGHIINQ